MGEVDVIVRAGRPEDASAVNLLLARTWRSAYRGLIAPDESSRLHAAWHAPDVLSRQALDPRGRFLVAAIGSGEIVGHGFAIVAEDVLSVLRLYVAPDRQRMGIGRQLLGRMVAGHRGRTRLHVVLGNAPALAFYKALGFTEVGEVESEEPRSMRLEREEG